MYPFSTPLPCFKLTLPHSSGCSRILSTSEHQVSQSVCLCVCGGGWICLSLSLSHHTHTHTHTQLLFNSILISPCLPLGDLSTLLRISWLNFPTLSNCLVWGIIFHYHQPWYHPGSKAPEAQPPVHRMFPQLPNLSSIGSFMMTIPSSYQSPPLALFFQALVIEPHMASCM